jgi:16S rRNA C967 or C1407 C5-methylase (RsmB/RsmF family)
MQPKEVVREERDRLVEVVHHRAKRWTRVEEVKGRREAYEDELIHEVHKPEMSDTVREEGGLVEVPKGLKGPEGAKTRHR